MLTRLARTFALATLVVIAIAPAAQAAAPTNDTYATPTVIPTDGGVVTSSVADATKEAGENPLKGIDNDWLWTTWYSWTMPATALSNTKVVADLCGADIASEPVENPTRLSTLLAADGINGTSIAAAEDGCEVRAGGQPRVAKLSFTATPGTGYRMVVGSPFTAIGNVTLALHTAPFATSPATLKGLNQAGFGITVTAPTWNGGGTVSGPVWQRCNADGVTCFDIVGAYGPGYLLRTSDIGDRIRAVYTATNSIGTAVVASTATATITKVDTDLDGTPDDVDYDDDNDFVPDAAEITFRYDPLRVDSDGDGISDTTEACTTFQYCAQVLETKTFVVAKDGSNKLVEVVGTKKDDVIVTGTVQQLDGTLKTVSSAMSTLCNGVFGNDTCIGGAAKDLCIAGAGKDVCLGGAGNDSCISTMAKDVCFGGAGSDQCTVKVQLAPASAKTAIATPPTTTCDGGTGNDSCTATLSAPNTKTTAAILALTRQLGGSMSATCVGGAGDDTCKVATRSWDPVTDAITTVGSFVGAGISSSAASSAKMATNCSGGVGDDRCFAKNSISWLLDGTIGAPGAVMTCNGGPGNDLLFTANGKGGDMVNGGADKDVCIVDATDITSSCEVLIALQLKQTAAQMLTAKQDQLEQKQQALASATAQISGTANGGAVPNAVMEQFIGDLDAMISVALNRLIAANTQFNSMLDDLASAMNDRSLSLGRVGAVG